MRQVIVENKYNNKKLSNCVLENFSSLKQSVFYKALRKKDIKVNRYKSKGKYYCKKR